MPRENVLPQPFGCWKFSSAREVSQFLGLFLKRWHLCNNRSTSAPRGGEGQQHYPYGKSYNWGRLKDLGAIPCKGWALNLHRNFTEAAGVLQRRCKLKLWVYPNIQTCLSSNPQSFKEFLWASGIRTVKLELLEVQNRILLRSQNLVRAAGTFRSRNVLQSVPPAAIADTASSAAWPKCCGHGLQLIQARFKFRLHHGQIIWYFSLLVSRNWCNTEIPNFPFKAVDYSKPGGWNDFPEDLRHFLDLETL